MSDQTGVSGSDILDELIAREAQDESGRFKTELARRRTVEELERLRRKRAEFDAKEQQLQRRLDSNRVEA